MSAEQSGGYYGSEQAVADLASHDLPSATDLGLQTHVGALTHIVGDLRGLDIVDLGCGEGVLGKELARRGARVTGIDPLMEPVPEQKLADGSFRILQSGGEAVPLPSRSADLSIFLYSLHHMPALTDCLHEAIRLLRPSGRLYVAEPLARGPMYHLTKSFHDEARVRANALKALGEVGAEFEVSDSFLYFDRRVITSFDGFASRMIANTRFNDYEADDVTAPQVVGRFKELLALNGGNFDQPVVVYSFSCPVRKIDSTIRTGPASMTSTIIVYCVIFIAIASLLRGLTGFGFAIVASPLLALVAPPLVAVAVVTLLQIPAGLPVMMRDWADTDFKAAATAWLAGIPMLLPGLYLVSRMPQEPMRIVLGVIVVLSAIALSLGLRMARPPRTGELIGVGVLSGFLQGAAAMAGPPIVVLLLASSWPAARCRATLSSIFLLLGATSVMIGLWRGLMSSDDLLLSAYCLPGLLVGQRIGAYAFARMDHDKYRPISLATIAMTGILVIGKGLYVYVQS